MACEAGLMYVAVRHKSTEKRDCVTSRFFLPPSLCGTCFIIPVLLILSRAAVQKKNMFYKIPVELRRSSPAGQPQEEEQPMMGECGVCNCFPAPFLAMCSGITHVHSRLLLLLLMLRTLFVKPFFSPSVASRQAGRLCPRQQPGNVHPFIVACASFIR